MIGTNSDKNDPFEEFEFRPINEGLGFHNKTKTAPPAGASIQFTTQTATPISPITKSSSPFQTALPRNDMRSETRSEIRSQKSNFNIPTIEDDSIAKAQSAVNDILKNLNQKRQLDFAQDAETERRSLKKSKPQLFASVLDSMLVIAAFLMTLILMLSITKVDMILNLTHVETSGMVYFSTLALLAAVAFIYMVVNRAFLGYTPGEWAFDQQCGITAEQSTLMYIPKVALRTFLVIASGFVLLPLLSYLFNKDVAGNLAGVPLFKKPYG